MLLCRPFFSALVLHWHAVGLGEWLSACATAPEHWISRQLLGRADLALVLAADLASDAERLAPKRIAVVANGIQVNSGIRRRAVASPREVLFLGLCTREKGVFDVLSAVATANERLPGNFRVTVAGAFACPREEHAFRSQAALLGPDSVRYVGFVGGRRKSALFASADIFCFPTTYAHEAQPLALIEALAHDVPIVATRWRAIPGMLPAKHVWLVDPHCPGQIAAALIAASAAGGPQGFLRGHYLSHFTRERHLAALGSALQSLHRASARPAQSATGPAASPIQRAHEPR